MFFHITDTLGRSVFQDRYLAVYRKGLKRFRFGIFPLTIFLLCFHYGANAQIYNDYIGEGHDVGVSVTTSDETPATPGAHTLTGKAIITDEYLSSRFLAQASLGYNYEDITHLADIGVNAWIEEQFAMTPYSFIDTYDDLFQEALTIAPGTNPKFEFFQHAFYERIFETDDKLRQKVAFSLSQIFVTAPSIDVLIERGNISAAYYDNLYSGAFGNFRDILLDVSLSPAMGIYLSHYENRKADPVLGTLPDENYAREIMQLFSIGLHELNNNGSYKLDGNGKQIPTYDIADIQELAKVFTGLSGGQKLVGTPNTFGTDVGRVNLKLPMIMYEEFHEPGEKIMIDGTVIPAGQSGMTDINQAIDVLYNHPNVGPFIGLRLIQQLVKSNPTPQYINRVATAFNNNGQGIRGDMKAVIHAILTDPEARDEIWISDLNAGKLRQPLERITQLFTAFDLTTPSGKYYLRDVHSHNDRILQDFFKSPSVFNFFSPFYAEKDFVKPAGLLSPEFQILNATTAMHYINLLEESLKVIPFYNYTAPDASGTTMVINTNDNPTFNFTDEINAYNTAGISGLLDRLDLILCHGQLTLPVRDIITNTINLNVANLPDYTADNAVRDAIYYIMITPDYILLK